MRNNFLSFLGLVCIGNIESSPLEDRSKASALRLCFLQPYVSATLWSERKRV